MKVRVLLVALAVSWVGCVGVGGSGDGVSGSEIVIEPEGAVLTVVDGTGPEQAYTATLVSPQGKRSDVTDRVVWSVEDPVGNFSGPVFQASGTAAAHTRVVANLDSASGSADLTVRIEGVRVEAPLSAEVPGWFAGASEDAALAPNVVYPSFGTVVPPNFGDFEVHWDGALGADVFEVSVVTDLVDLRVYTQNPNPRVATFTSGEWQIVADTHRGQTVGLGVAAMNSTDTSRVGRSEASDVRLALEDVAGGIYYWAPSPGTIYRHDFQNVGQPAEEFYREGNCVGCHSISRDGTKMGVTLTGGGGPGAIVDIATQQAITPTTTIFWNFATFSPNGDKLLTVTNGAMALRDPNTALEEKAITGAGYATHPDWSPTGDFIVYTDASDPHVDWRVAGAKIYRRDYTAGGDTFGTPVQIATDIVGNAFYPAVSPDGTWILFNTSTNDSYDDPTTELHAVKADGSGTSFKLQAPNVGTGLTNSWPRWAPFQQTEEDGETVFWFTFSSTRPVGVLTAAARSQIWMAAFYPERAAQGEPASAPAFRLPFQNFATSNHSAQWTTRVVDVVE